MLIDESNYDLHSSTEVFFKEVESSRTINVWIMDPAFKNEIITVT